MNNCKKSQIFARELSLIFLSNLCCHRRLFLSDRWKSQGLYSKSFRVSSIVLGKFYSTTQLTILHAMNTLSRLILMLITIANLINYMLCDLTFLEMWWTEKFLTLLQTSGEKQVFNTYNLWLNSSQTKCKATFNILPYYRGRNDSPWADRTANDFRDANTHPSLTSVKIHPTWQWMQTIKMMSRLQGSQTRKLNELIGVKFRA